MVNKKQKLIDMIGRAVHQHIDRVKEASTDYVVLSLRRGGVAADEDHLRLILETFRNAIDSEHMNKLDQLVVELDSGLDKFIEEEDE